VDETHASAGLAIRRRGLLLLCEEEQQHGTAGGVVLPCALPRCFSPPNPPSYEGTKGLYFQVFR
jgi:hypothetical protein